MCPGPTLKRCVFEVTSPVPSDGSEYARLRGGGDKLIRSEGVGGGSPLVREVTRLSLGYSQRVG